jgi:hypothetical protein
LEEAHECSECKKAVSFLSIWEGFASEINRRLSFTGQHQRLMLRKSILSILRTDKPRRKTLFAISEFTMKNHHKVVAVRK